MKKAILFIALAAGTAGMMTSCGKSSKGKLAADWKLDSMTSTEVSTSGSSSSTTTTTISGTSYSKTQSSGGTSVTTTGTVKTATWTIEKDGTWTRTMEIEMTGTQSGVSYTNNSKTVSSGTWDFLAGKTDGFKKNERVVFNTLSSTETDTYTAGSISNIDTETTTYKDGENSMIYVISESKKKELVLTFSGATTDSDGSSSSSYTTEETTTLSAE